MSIRDKWMMLHLTVLVAGCGIGGLTTLTQKAEIEDQMQRFQQVGPGDHTEIFKTMDLNEDGAVVRDEFIAAFDKLPPPPPRGDASSSEEIKPDVNLIADRFFNDADTDKDSKVTLEEFQALRPPAPEEGPRHGMRRHRMPPSPESMFKHFDHNSDGYIVREEMLVLPEDCPPPPPMRPEMASGSTQPPERPSLEEMADSFMTTHDLDKDGKVSLDELKASAPTPPAPLEQN